MALQIKGPDFTVPSSNITYIVIFLAMHFNWDWHKLVCMWRIINKGNRFILAFKTNGIEHFCVDIEGKTRIKAWLK